MGGESHVIQHGVREVYLIAKIVLANEQIY